MVDYQTISIVLTGIGLMIALTYYALQIRNQNRTRQAQLFMQIYNRWTDTEFNENFIDVINRDWKDYDDWNMKFSEKVNPQATARQRTIGQYFEGVGVLVYRNLIDVNLVDDMMSSLLLNFWEKQKPVIMGLREHYKHPQILEWTEYLYNEVKKVVESQHPELKT